MQRARGRLTTPITFNEEPLPPDDPLFTGGLKIVYGDVAPVEEEDVEFVSPSVPGRRVVARSLLDSEEPEADRSGDAS